MPLNAVGWTNKEDEDLIELVKPHSCLYDPFDFSRNNVIAREITWQNIAQTLSRTVEECKKRWRGLRDGYMRSKRLHTIHKTKLVIFEKLQFLSGVQFDGTEEYTETSREEIMNEHQIQNNYDESMMGKEEQVITDNQEYYEITVVESPQDQDMKPIIHIMPKTDANESQAQPRKKRKYGGRKRASLPANNHVKSQMSADVKPIKILPKPLIMNGAKLLSCVGEQTTPEQRSQTIDKLIERMLKENTNEIDVFFRSMAASVKKLQPNLIPKVKMEVCNVIAKYEMQSFDTKKGNS